MRHHYRWHIVTFCLWFVVACYPVQSEGSTLPSSTVPAASSDTEVASDVINIFIPLPDEDLEALNTWLSEQQLTERIHISTEHELGQKLDAWFYPKGAQANYDIRITALDELNNLDWSVAQFEDNNTDNLWAATLIKTGGDDYTADVLNNIENIFAQLPDDAPPLISPSAIENPDEVMRVQISPDGRLIEEGVACPVCYVVGTSCIRCPHGGRWPWCPLKVQKEISIFVPTDDSTVEILESQLREMLPGTQINLITKLETGQSVDAWIIPKDAQSTSTTPIETLSALDDINWKASMLQNVDPQKAWSIGILNTGGTEHVDQLIKSLDILISQNVIEEHLPSLSDNFDQTSIDQFQISPEGTLFSEGTTCETCISLVE